MQSRHDDEQDVFEEQDAAPSKTQRKRAMEALQEIGEALVALEPSALAKFSLPDFLLDAVLEAQGLKAHGARRRQMQYIGRLMREVDADAISQQLEAFQDGSQARKRYDRLIEGWRDRLINDSNGLTALLAEYPQADKELFTRYIAQAREEIQKSVSTPKAFRLIYRSLKTLMPFTLGD